ncbi:MAG: aminopeptidase N C-terminal domain-containing protein, partial [Hyphomonadaceae bacterium]
PLVIDKWFAVQARAGDIADIEALRRHPDFDLGNPNRVRALAAAFAMQNLAGFHKSDGSGHAFLAKLVREVDPLNSALAARLLTAFEQWKSLEPAARQTAMTTLQSLAKDGLSQNASDIIGRAIG